MLGINHTATGVLIAIAAKKPEIAAPAALTAHFLMDALPHHGDPRAKFGTRTFAWRVGLDGALSLLIMLAAAAFTPPLAGVIIIACFFSVLPDLVWPLALHAGARERLAFYFRFHKSIQWSETPKGIWVEAAWFAAVAAAIALAV